MRITNTFFQRGGKLGVLALICLLSLAGSANADESFTLSAAFYQGVDLNTGMTELDATVLTLKFGSDGNIEIVFTPSDLENPFDFSAAVDFHFEYNAGSLDPLVFVPDADTLGVAVFAETDFDALGADGLAEIAFDQNLAPIALKATDTLVLLTGDNTYIKLGNLSQVSDLNVEFSYQKMAAVDPGVPEPSTLLLLGLGLLGLLRVLRRKAR